VHLPLLMTSREWELNFDRIEYCGRSDEISILAKAANEVDELKNPRVVFISGDSGSGKTSLCKELEQLSSSRFFISGKFDELNCGPYSAVRDAMSDLCNQLSECDQIEKIKESLRESLGSEDSILKNAVPECQNIIGAELGTSTSTIDVNETFAFNRLKLSFRALLTSALCTGRTVVMFIDDLQWACRDSWDLIRYFLHDTTLTSFLFIGAFRENQMSTWRCNHINAVSESLNVIKISLKAFDDAQVNELVSLILNMRKEKTRSLARVIHTKCGGNPYFCIQMLRALEKHNFIRFSMVNFCWEWDIETIKVNTDVGDNLVDTFLMKINHLPSGAKRILTFAACLGGKFETLLLERVFTSGYLADICTCKMPDDLDLAIEIALQEGLIKGMQDSNVYRFVHDKIHQAFYSLITSKGEPDLVHLGIGRALLSVTKERHNVDRSLLFLTVDQLKKCSHMITCLDEKLVIAKLTLAAAKAAIHSSAFRPASEFLSYGLKLLEKECASHFQTRLELLVHLSRTELCLGRLSICHSAVNEVLTCANTTLERTPVFQVCVDAYGAANDLINGVKVGLTFLDQLGVRVPKKFNKITVFMAYVETKWRMRGITEDSILTYKAATDPYKVAAMKIISALTHFTFQIEMLDAMATLVFLNTSLCLKYGFIEESGTIFGNYGLLLAFAGDFTESYIISQKACLKLCERATSTIPRSFMNFYGGLNHLRSPLHSSLEPLLRGYRLGFEVGDTVNGFFCCLIYLEIFYFVGLPLMNLLKDIESFSQDMDTYNIKVTLDYLKVYHQSVLNLTEDSELENPVKLDGIAMTELELMQSGIKKVVDNFWLCKLLLATYFQDYKAISESLEFLSFQRHDGVDGCMYWVSTSMWCEGLGALHLARATRKRKYGVLARKRLKGLRNWAKNGNVNCYHSILHLEAEFAVLRRQPHTQIKILFDSAISAARRAGLTNFVAVTNERAGLYFLAIQDNDRASSYLLNAFEMYESWGANAKSKALIRDYPNLFPSLLIDHDSSMRSQSTGTSHLGRVRHTSIEENLHHGRNLNLV
jgi:predicted ATPase